MGVRYAKQDIYADVAEEGGQVRRLVAVKGEPVPDHYGDLVSDSDVTEDIDEARDLFYEDVEPPETPVAPHAPEQPEEPTGEGETSEGGPEEPLKGYDGLSAKDVVAELKDASQATVEKVKAYEAANKGRSTILDYGS